MKFITKEFELASNYPTFTSTFSDTVKEHDENYKICQEVERYQHLLYMYKNEFIQTNKEEDLTHQDFNFMEHVLNLKRKLGSLQVEYNILSKANQAIMDHTAQLEKLKSSLQNDNKTFSELVCLYSEESKPFRGLGDVYDDMKDDKLLKVKEKINSNILKCVDNKIMITTLEERIDLLEKMINPNPEKTDLDESESEKTDLDEPEPEPEPKQIYGWMDAVAALFYASTLGFLWWGNTRYSQ